MTKPPTNPAEHALDFSRRYAVDLDIAAGQIMLELGIAPGKIGVSDPEHGIRHASFHPHGRDAGSVSPDGRINLDSGVMNPDQLITAYGDDVAGRWRKLRLKDRMQAIVAHEHAEHRTGTHLAALRAGPETRLPISQQARDLLRAMDRGWRG